jgi:hypothetical protein
VRITPGPWGTTASWAWLSSGWRREHFPSSRFWRKWLQDDKIMSLPKAAKLVQPTYRYKYWFLARTARSVERFQSLWRVEGGKAIEAKTGEHNWKSTSWRHTTTGGQWLPLTIYKVSWMRSPCLRKYNRGFPSTMLNTALVPRNGQNPTAGSVFPTNPTCNEVDNPKLYGERKGINLRHL